MKTLLAAHAWNCNKTLPQVHLKKIIYNTKFYKLQLQSLIKTIFNVRQIISQYECNPSISFSPNIHNIHALFNLLREQF